MVTCVLVAAARAPWETAVLKDLAAAGMVVLRRCVDLDDLLALSLQGQAEAAVVAAGLSGLDADAVRRLADAGVGLVAVSAREPTGEPEPGEERMTRLGVSLVRPQDVVLRLREVVTADLRPPASCALPMSADHPPVESASHRGQARGGTVVAVWGPTGAPGRSTVAAALAAERVAQRPDDGSGVVLGDVDPWGGTLAQQLGVVEDVSGLLAVARLVNEAALDHASLAGCLRTVSPGLGILTGLPRVERWREIRGGVVADMVELARAETDVVLDCGFAIETDERSGVPRNVATLEALEAADAIVVVGSAEAIGLTRLARALVALTEVVARPPAVVVVNRMRDSLGWRHHDVSAMIDGFAPGVPVHFWPEERALLDRAVVSGRSLAELGEHALRRCARELEERVFGVDPQLPKRG